MTEGGKRKRTATRCALSAKRVRDSSAKGSDDDVEVVSVDFPNASRKSSASRASSRGKGRPVTTGQFVGPAAAKRQLAEAEEKELRVQAERELMEHKRVKRETRAPFTKKLSSRENLDSLDPVDSKRKAATRVLLLREVEDAVDTVTGVARSSRNLKGTAVKALKIAAETILEAAEGLGALQATEEMRRLERENATLREDILQLRKKLEEVKAGLAGGASLRQRAPPPFLRRHRPRRLWVGCRRGVRLREASGHGRRKGRREVEGQRRSAGPFELSSPPFAQRENFSH